MAMAKSVHDLFDTVQRLDNFNAVLMYWT